MKIIDFNDILINGENEQVEFKISFSKEVIESVSAFANTKGGWIFLGINNQGEPTGFETGPESIQKMINQIKDSTEPSVIVSAENIQYDGKPLLIFKVDEFPVKPVSFKGRYYKRVVNSNHLLDSNEISNMHLESLQLSWDSYPAAGVNFADLDQEKIHKFIDKVNQTGRFRLSIEPKEALSKLRLIDKNKVSNAAALLFAEEDILYNIHIGRFKTPTMIIDDKMVRKPLFEALDEAMNIIIGHLKVAFEITGKQTQRTEIFEYPLPAVREMLLNSIIHRDYTSPVDNQIKIFDQAIQLFNPGKLYGDLKIEDLKTDFYASNTRNRLIAEAFYLIGEIEKYGSGFGRIRNEIKKYPTMEFKYSEMGNGFNSSLGYNARKLTAEKAGVEEGDRGREKGKNGGKKKGKSGALNGVLNGALNLREKDILETLKKHPGINRQSLSALLEIPVRTLEKNLSIMSNNKKIKFVGSKKNGGYIISGKINKISDNSKDVQDEVHEENEQYGALNGALNGAINGALNGALNPREKDILETLKKYPGLNTTALAGQLQLSAKTLEKTIAKLRKKELIEFRGARKNGGYFLSGET